MFSIRKHSILLAAAAGGLASAGCASSSSSTAEFCQSCSTMTRQRAAVVVKTPVPVADEPGADEATEMRGWNKSVAFYHSGATQAWPTRWYHAPNPDYSSPFNFAADSLAFIGQTASLPVTLALEPPFKQPVVYAGDVLPPTYTASPPVPPEPANSVAVPDPDPLAQPQSPVTPPLPPIAEEHPPVAPPPPAPAPMRPMTAPVRFIAPTSAAAKPMPVQSAPTTRAERPSPLPIDPTTRPSN